MADIYEFLLKHGIPYVRYDHPPVYTTEDVERLVPQLPAARTKNLFVRDSKGKRHLLIVTTDRKRVDLEALAGFIDSGKLSFASRERMQRYIGVDAGAVSLLAVINDTSREVEVVIDKAVWHYDAFQFHPLSNTSTLVITKGDVVRFAEATGHRLLVADVPGRLSSGSIN